MLNDAALPVLAKLAACALVSYLSKHTNAAFPSQETLAQMLGRKKRQINEALWQLASRGHIEIKRSRRSTCDYVPRLRADVLTAESPDQEAQFAATQEAACSTDVPDQEAQLSAQDVRETASLKSEAGQERQSRAPRTAASCRQTLKNPNNPPTPQVERKRPDSVIAAASAAGTEFSVPSDLRAEICSARSEGFAASYIDPAAWRSSDRTIVCRLSFSADKIRQECGALLRRLGVSIIGDAAEHAALMDAAALHRRAA